MPASYSTTLKTAGTPTGFTAEATTDLGGDVYQITNANKGAWDHTNAIVVYDGASPIPASGITSIDYLFGIVTLAATPAGAVTIDGTYIPLAVMTEVHDFALNIEGDILDNTAYDKAQANGGYRNRLQGLLDVTFSMNRYGDGANKYLNHRKARDIIFVEINPFGTTQVIRGWFLEETAGSSGDVSSLEDESINFNLEGSEGKVFSWRTI